VIPAAALLLALAGPVAAQDAAARMQPCLDASDAEFARSAGAKPEDRWARLEVIATGESRCLATLTAACLRRKTGEAACFEDVLGWARDRRRAALDDLPADLAEDAPLLAPDYARWRDRARAAMDAPAVQGCPLGPDAPPAACAALEAGTAWLEARDWARMIAVIREAQQ
jgi:hypothetical protein